MGQTAGVVHGACVSTRAGRQPGKGMHVLGSAIKLFA